LGGVEGPVVVKTGSYSFVAPNGETVHTSYVADEFGFHPTGSHMPVAPPMPVELVEAYRKAGVAL